MSTEQRGPSDPNFDPMDLFEGERPWEREPEALPEQPLELSWRADHERYVLRRATHIYEHAVRDRRRHERRQRVRTALRAGGFVGRTATLATMLVVVGATAYGATNLFGSSSNGPARGLAAAKSQIPISAGHSGPDHWALRAWQSEGQVCIGFVVADQEQTACNATPAHAPVRSLSLDSPTRRYFSGLTGSAVASIRVRAGNQVQIVATHPLGKVAKASRFPAGLRWFVVVLQRGTSVRQPRAHITALNANGRPAYH